jgi:hypothetical protein
MLMLVGADGDGAEVVEGLDFGGGESAIVEVSGAGSKR